MSLSNILHDNSFALKCASLTTEAIYGLQGKDLTIQTTRADSGDDGYAVVLKASNSTTTETCDIRFGNGELGTASARIYARQGGQTQQDDIDGSYFLGGYCVLSKGGAGLGLPVRTATQIGDSTDTCNKTGRPEDTKRAGVLLFNSTDSIVMVSVGDDSTSAWKEVGGTTTITPS